ncbi:MAG: hypothetical protein A3A97_03915 [Candidatus Terrybacteria bacterium RIFCSPLOWO2_01_FULL_40_23]|uniref:GIY-YIG domain-containing protein n=1 Tax=Candidatus Terrybacteria bacterium RIFCSPLOWO2_01_FULL_40_23 TaxID=1802366 RepID=A0A1G2PW38_9BACT|nr:MAG: hypothetical protein A3A97_03915 [Candidatus Terrybacteria bacterium RIFCSPLOWO2_01_FULL_40_23]
MYYLYVLHSELNERKYIGSTKDINARLIKHNSGSVRSTKAYRPWKIMHKEIFNNKTDARKRELELKKNGSKRKQLFDSL